MKPETGGNDGQQSFERDQRIQQRNDEYDIDELKEELADVYSYVLMMADAVGVDLEEITLEKLEKNKAKYPVEKFKGVSTKYNKLETD